MISVKPHSVTRGDSAMTTSTPTTTHESRLPMRVSRSSGAPSSRVTPTTSLARIDDRLSSTESAVDITAATTAVMTTTQSTIEQHRPSAPDGQQCGHHLVGVGAVPESSRMARMPTMNMTPVVTSGRKTITLKARFSVAASREA